MTTKQISQAQPTSPQKAAFYQIKQRPYSSDLLENFIHIPPQVPLKDSLTGADLEGEGTRKHLIYADVSWDYELKPPSLSRASS